MIAPNENPLFPASLAETKHSPQETRALILALTAIDAAREQLERYGLATDDPVPGAAEAADLLDAALHVLMSSAEFSDALKGARGGGA